VGVCLQNRYQQCCGWVQSPVRGKRVYQTEGVDYFETSAPTIMDTTLRMLLQYAAEWKLTIQQIDVKTAFLNRELIEEVYILPPPGLGLSKRVWKLNKALYGLKQAARAWYEKWTKVLFKMLGLSPVKQTHVCTSRKLVRLLTVTT
jgi:hypothetical protein